ncbi:MAG: hypothetical protein MUC74_06700 [Ideonella sp.]|jgi:hypothetical protein|nr:hypothetical protein [Ideonella sp.]
MDPLPPAAYLSYRAGDTDREVEQLRHSLMARAGEHAAWLGASAAGVDTPTGAQACGLSGLARAAVVLVVVGPRWAEGLTPGGRSVLADPADPVRGELLEAIDRRLPMLVVLVRGARMLRAADLPVELTALAQRPSVEVHPARWEFDVAALVELVKPLLGSRRSRPAARDGARSAPVPLDSALDLRERAARIGPGTAGVGRAAQALGLAVLGTAGVALAAWLYLGSADRSASPAPAPAASVPPDVHALSPLRAAMERLAQAQAEATLAAAMAQASLRAADAAAAGIPPDAPPEDRARWQGDVARLRAEAQAAQRRASELARQAAEAQAALDALHSRPPAARPADVAGPGSATDTAAVPGRTADEPPSELSVSPSPSPSPSPAPDAAAAAAAAVPDRSAPAPAPAQTGSLSLANWAIATTSGCGAGELRAVGTNEITISRTPSGVLVSQAFQGAAGPWRLSTSGSAVFPAPRPTYEIESSGLWTRDGARPFRSVSRLTVTARDGGLVPVGARGSQYRTECPGG